GWLTQPKFFGRVPKGWLTQPKLRGGCPPSMSGWPSGLRHQT
ncbi:Neurogenic locus notch-like protein 2, partial [Frankliniella fusca]